MKDNINKKETTILDSRLIIPTLDSVLYENAKIPYNIKLVDCGTYVQVYFYDIKKVRRKSKDKSELKLIKNNIKDTTTLNTNKNTNSSENIIENRNIIRSKLECQRLAKANIEDWKTFITLTFEENITDIKEANKRFSYFIDKVRRVKKDFKYLCVIEFQKRGSIHYHILTNIDYNDTTLLYTQENNNKFKHIKYWTHGFTSIEIITNDPKKVIGYISKYMTKEIDNRLFNHRRFFGSKNLNKPIENFINTDNKNELDYLTKKIQEKSLIYQNEYISPYDNNKVKFLEFQK